MLMFANPIFPIIAIFSGSGLAAVMLLAWKWLKWLKKDPNKDTVIFFGPKQGGKSELLSALKGEAFDPKRTGTGMRILKIGVKDFLVSDSDGARKNIKTYTDRMVEYIKEKQPNFVLVVLVVNVQDLGLLNGKGVSVEQMDMLAEYLDFFTTTSEDEFNAEGKIKKVLGENYFAQRYNDGHWAYAIIGTHLAKMDKSIVADGLANISRHLDQYSRKMRFAGADAFELSENKMRKSTVCFIGKLLERVHSSQ